MHANARLIRDFHEALNRFYAGGDIEPVGAMLTDNVVWQVPGRSRIAGDHIGRDEVLDYFHSRREMGRGAFEVDVLDVLANDARAVLLASGSERGGRGVAWETVGIFAIEDGKIGECRLLPFDQYSFDELWSWEPVGRAQSPRA
jgi:ketosteroid isomerase-like protein